MGIDVTLMALLSVAGTFLWWRRRRDRFITTRLAFRSGKLTGVHGMIAPRVKEAICAVAREQGLHGVVELDDDELLVSRGISGSDAQRLRNAFYAAR